MGGGSLADTAAAGGATNIGQAYDLLGGSGADFQISGGGNTPVSTGSFVSDEMADKSRWKAAGELISKMGNSFAPHGMTLPDSTKGSKKGLDTGSSEQDFAVKPAGLSGILPGQPSGQANIDALIEWIM